MDTRLKRYIDSIVRRAVVRRFRFDSLWGDLATKMTNLASTITSTKTSEFGSEANRASKRIARQLMEAVGAITNIKEKIPVPVGQWHWPAGWSNANVYKVAKTGMDDIIGKVVGASKTLEAKETDFKSPDAETFFQSLYKSLGDLISKLTSIKKEMPSPNNLESSRNKEYAGLKKNGSGKSGSLGSVKVRKKK